MRASVAETRRKKTKQKKARAGPISRAALVTARNLFKDCALYISLAHGYCRHSRAALMPLSKPTSFGDSLPITPRPITKIGLSEILPELLTFLCIDLYISSSLYIIIIITI